MIIRKDTFKLHSIFCKIGILLLALVLFGCGGSIGKITTPISVSPLDTNTTIYFSRQTGIYRWNLRESSPKYLFPSDYGIEDISDDGDTFVLKDSKTNLYVISKNAPLREVYQLRGRTGSVSISPDGETIAATRHADFSLPQSSWVDDDSVYLIDVGTLNVRIVPASVSGGKENFALGWTKSGKAIFVFTPFGGTTSKVTLPKGVRIKSSFDEVRDLRVRAPGRIRDRVACRSLGLEITSRGWKFDKGIDLETKDGKLRTLVTIEGRTRGFHDYQETIRTPAFTKDCRYVLFEYDGDIWAADISKGGVRRLEEGYSLFF